MTETRRHFHDALDLLEHEVQEMGELAIQALGRAAEALRSGDEAVAAEVIAGDDEVDDRYLAIDQQVLLLIAQQTPVAGDLRLLASILHINVHLERVGDAAVTVGKIVKSTQGQPTRPSIADTVAEMALVVADMTRVALTAFTQRDLELALRLPEMDEPVDTLHRGIYAEVIACKDDPALLDWALRMLTASRAIERAGDHAVDIAEQVAFLLTGEFREFSDASHPTEDQPKRPEM